MAFANSAPKIYTSSNPVTAPAARGHLRFCLDGLRPFCLDGLNPFRHAGLLLATASDRPKLGRQASQRSADGGQV